MIAAVYVPCHTCNIIAIKDMKQEVVSCHTDAHLPSEKCSLHAVNTLQSTGKLSRCFFVFFGAECQCKRNEKDLFIKLSRTGKHTHAHAAYALF